MAKNSDCCMTLQGNLKTKNYDLKTVIPGIKYSSKILKVTQPLIEVAIYHCDLHIPFGARLRTQDSGFFPNPEKCEPEVPEHEEAQSLAHMGPAPVVYVLCSVCRYN